MFLTLLLALVGCKYEEDIDTDSVGTTPVCDGVQQLEEAQLDGPFDQDGDGFFDAADPGCAETWLPSQLDCDDSDPLVNPAALEIPCNGVDEDCRDASPDNADNDGDGVGVCDDCNDQNPLVYPESEEICFDGFDNDCDGVTDNGCGEDYNGTWIVSPDDINYTCNLLGSPLVDMDFQELLVLWIPPNLSISSGTSAQPPAIDGTVEADGSFSIASSIGGVGACVEDYTIEGVFTSATTVEGTFTYNFTASLPGACGPCGIAPQTREFTATRQ